MKIPMRQTAKDWWRSTHYPRRVPADQRREMRTIGSLALWLSLLVLAAGATGVVTGGVVARGVGCVLIACATVLVPTSWMIYRTGRKDKETR